jgi:hypothetical protein
VSKKPQSPMNRAKPTKKATATSKREGDKPIVEAVGSAGEWQLRRAEERNLPAVFLCWTPAVGSSCISDLDTSSPVRQPTKMWERPCASSSLHRTTVDGSIEMLGDWFTPKAKLIKAISLRRYTDKTSK